MRTTTRTLLTVAGFALLVWIIGGVLALVFGWPTQFVDSPSPDIGLAEFIFRGTATSAPVIPIMVLLILFMWLSTSRGRWGTVGVVGMCLLSVLTFIGGLGEAFAPPTPHVPQAVLVTSGVVSCLISLTLLFVGIADLRDRSRMRRRTSAKPG